MIDRDRRFSPLIFGTLLLTQVFCTGLLRADELHELHDLTLDQLVAKVSDDYSRPRDLLAKNLEAYHRTVEAGRESARRELQMRLATAIRAYGETSHNALAVEATLDWLDGNGAPPNDVAAIKWIASYADRISGSQKKLLRNYSMLTKQLNKDGRDEDIKILNAGFRRLEATPKKEDQVLVGRSYKGYRTTTDGKRLVSLILRIEEGTDLQFRGKVERDHMYSGHPIHETVGTSQGSWVTIQTGKLLAFGNKSDHAWTYAGFILNRSLVGTYAGRDKKGKTMGGIFVVRSGR